MTFSRRAAQVTETLSDCATSLEQRGPAHWVFSPIGAADLCVETRVDGDWLALTMQLPERDYQPSPLTLWKMLEENGRLPGGVKLARVAGRKEVSACAELRLDEEIDLNTRLSEVCDGLQVCAGLKTAGSVNRAVPENGESVDVSQASDLRGLLDETGRGCTERPSGALVVDLDVGDGVHQATLEKRANGQVAVTTDLTRLEEDGPAECRQALSLLLLRACAVVRMARGAADAADNEARARFEVVFESAPSAAELTHALGSLGAARGLCAKEARLLASDEGIARQYLALGMAEPLNGG